MNKYLMMSAAAVLTATGGSAHAAGEQSGNIVFSGTCSGIALHWQGQAYAAAYLNCSGTPTAYGQGLAGKTKGIGKNVDLSDNYVIDGSNTESVNFDISLPLKNGGKWFLWLQLSGVTSFEANAGKYNLGGATKYGTGQSVLAKSLAAIARHKADNQQ